MKGRYNSVRSLKDDLSNEINSSSTISINKIIAVGLFAPHLN